MRARLLALGVALLVAGCSVVPSTRRHDPYPFVPAPMQAATSIDGWYTREVPVEALGGDAPCIRCPPYKLAPGSDILGFNQGVFRAYHWGNGYVAVGNYRVDRALITLFNDAWCPASRGSYRLSRAGNTTTLRAVDDACAFDAVRTTYFEVTAWRRLSPPEGVYLSNEGGELLIVDGRFEVKDAGVNLVGTYRVSGATITFTADGCTHRFRWTEQNGLVYLGARGRSSCDADLPAAWYSAT